ncbi:restriction endonuclease [Roseivirga sp. BDSF3-8]|uniref:restriction endonuclease n=1 Tax=Roseivirga sp. BDSF3-8 TaxID=3241598 RepID=UPI003531CEE8
MPQKKKQAEFIKWFGPLLDALRELGYSGKPREVSEKIAEMKGLKERTLDATLKSGTNRFHNQVAWARQYLVWEGLLDSSIRGTWRLTEKGKKTSLTEEEAREIFLKWVEINRQIREEKAGKQQVAKEESTEAPDEITFSAEDDLLSVLKSVSPEGFEYICMELLREHGFVSLSVTPKGADGGIDGFGVLEINPFVTMKIAFQSKRYKGSVSRAQIGDFRSAIMGKAEKGIMITTGTYTRAAQQEASRDGATPIELIDGEKLIQMFEKVELGLKPKVVYEVDLNYFDKFR